MEKAIIGDGGTRFFPLSRVNNGIISFVYLDFSMWGCSDVSHYVDGVAARMSHGKNKTASYKKLQIYSSHGKRNIHQKHIDFVSDLASFLVGTTTSHYHDATSSNCIQLPAGLFSSTNISNYIVSARKGRGCRAGHGLAGNSTSWVCVRIFLALNCFHGF